MFAKSFKLLDVFPHGAFSFVLYLFMLFEPLIQKKSIYVNALLFSRAHRL